VTPPVVASTSPSGASRWVIRFRERPQARLRLFCLPYAGGGASVYHGWAVDLPSHVEVCAVQLPGREGRYGERLFTDVHALVAPLCDGIAPFLDRPFALFGHSLGAVLAYETAVALVRGRAPSPMALFVSGHRAPGLPPTRHPIHDLPEREFLAELQRLNGVPPELFEDRELLDLVLPQLRADFRMAETYAPSPPDKLTCAIVALGATEDDRVSRATLEPWRELTTGPFQLTMLPGDHFYVKSHRSRLLELIAARLAEFLR
jgi:medium-chain acyl-[acyl-carrier-protein] hydrolase